MQVGNNDCLMLHVQFKAVWTVFCFWSKFVKLGDQAFWRGELCDKIDFNLDEM